MTFCILITMPFFLLLFSSFYVIFFLHYFYRTFSFSTSIIPDFCCIMWPPSSLSVKVVYSVFTSFLSSLVSIRLSFLLFFISVIFCLLFQLSIMVFAKGDLWWGSNSLSEFKAFILSRRSKKLSFFFLF